MTEKTETEKAKAEDKPDAGDHPKKYEGGKIPKAPKSAQKD